MFWNYFVLAFHHVLVSCLKCTQCIHVNLWPWCRNELWLDFIYLVCLTLICAKKKTFAVLLSLLLSDQLKVYDCTSCFTVHFWCIAVFKVYREYSPNFIWDVKMWQIPGKRWIFSPRILTGQQNSYRIRMFRLGLFQVQISTNKFMIFQTNNYHVVLL